MARLSIRKWTRPALQFLAGAVLVGLAGWLAFRFWPRRALPQGWQAIRPPYDVMALAEYHDDIWAGGRDGLLRIDRDSGEVLEEVEADVELAYVTALLVDETAETLWVGHEGGLSCFKDGSWSTIGTEQGLPSERVLALAEDHDGVLWAGTDAGLVSLNGSPEVYTVEDGLAGDTVSTLYVDSGDRIWAGGGIFYGEGLSIYDGSSWEKLSVEDGLAHPMVNSILEYPNGTYWIGTGYSSYGGLSLFDGMKWRTIDREDGLPGWKVRLLFKDSLSTIWVSSEYNGIAFSSESNWTILTPEDGFTGWEVKTMLEDSEGDLWFGTENGLTRIEYETWERIVSRQ